MAKDNLNIVHLDTEKSWRGGQQQAFYLHKGLIEKGINSIFIGNKNSEILNRCKSENLPFYEQSMFGELDILAAIKIAQFCKKNKMTILQAHSAHALSIGLLVKLFIPSLILIGVRRVDFSIGKNKLSKLKYNTKLVNSIICISDFIKSVLIKDGVDTNKLVTIRSGVDVNKFKGIVPDTNFRKIIGVNDNQLLLGTVAAFAGHKDYPNLLKAFAEVVEKLPNTKLCIVGDGPLKNEIYKLVGELGLKNNIIFAGFVDNVGDYLHAFDIFILASKKEGLGTSIIDALSLGLPIIATKTGGIPELIKNGKNGILVEPQNHNILAAAIIDLINNPEKRKALNFESMESSKMFSIE
ncbi:MAG: glycosyltransferase, partial [Melioribacteraceae bacterium]|nr:glycosyltransferase [Melioribacteraceae bacterium]